MRRRRKKGKFVEGDKDEKVGEDLGGKREMKNRRKMRRVGEEAFCIWGRGC